jgi:hypothetical protein
MAVPKKWSFSSRSNRKNNKKAHKKKDYIIGVW